MTQQVDELFAETLSGDYDDAEPWAAVHALRRTGTRDVLERAVAWCGSEDPLKRARGADVLAQIGKTPEHRTNSFSDESYLAVSQLLQTERDTRPLSSAIHALGHIDNPLAIPAIAEQRNHESADVRFAVACALGSFSNDPRAIAVLLELTEDIDADVRDWATFNVGVIGDSDSAELRDALFRRLVDPNEDVREEAMVGLGKRKDERALPVLIETLQQPPAEPDQMDRAIEAAYLMLGLESDQEGWSRSDYVAALQNRFLEGTKN